MRLALLTASALVCCYSNSAAMAQDSNVRSFECVGMNHEQTVQGFSLSIAPSPSDPSIGVSWNDGGAIRGSPESVTFVKGATAEQSSKTTLYLTVGGVKYRADVLGLSRDNPTLRMHSVAGSVPSNAGLEADCRLSSTPNNVTMIEAGGSVDQPADQPLGWTRISSPIAYRCSFIDENASPWSASLEFAPNPSGSISDFAKFQVQGKTFEAEPANLASTLVDGQREIAGLMTFKSGALSFAVSARITGSLIWMNVIKTRNSPADIPYGDGVCQLLESQG